MERGAKAGLFFIVLDTEPSVLYLFFLFSQTRNTIDKLQTLVSSDGRFRNLRDALHRTDPPCIPYLGMYLSDLTFIEEGTPNFTDNGLLNFAKMRMVSAFPLRLLICNAFSPFVVVLP